jgi:capsular polysaccharide transport system permease protein
MIEALNTRLNVMRALIIRDLMGRYGRNHLGFIWTIIEPMILCTGVMFIWSMIRGKEEFGIPIVAFVFTGYMPLTLWRHLTGPLARILRSSSPLFYHQPIKHSDILLSRCVLEFISTSLAATLIYFVLAATHIIEPIHDPSLVLAGWILTAWYFGAQGLLISALTEYWEPAEKFIGPWNYLQLPVSGVFFLAESVPHYAQNLLLLNPSVHCFEMIRTGFFGPGVTTHYDPVYLIAWAAGLSVVAAAVTYHVRERVEVI